MLDKGAKLFERIKQETDATKIKANFWEIDGESMLTICVQWRIDRLGIIESSRTLPVTKILAANQEVLLHSLISYLNQNKKDSIKSRKAFMQTAAPHNGQVSQSEAEKKPKKPKV